MIRRYMKDTRNRKTRRKQKKIATSKMKDLSQFELLEDRRMLAFVSAFDGTTLTLTQTADDGAIVIDNNGAGNAFRATDGSGLVTFDAATNVTVDLLDSTGNQLDLDLDNAHTGDVTLNLGEGARTVNFTGTGNAMGGNLSVTGGTGNHTVEVAVNAGLSVTGSASFSLGTGFDVIDEDGNDITIGSDLNMTDVNRFENNGTMNVGGNVVYDTTADDTGGDFDNDTIMNIVGDFTYLGNDLLDLVQTNADFNLTGNFLANTASGGANYNLNNPDVNINGTTTLIATSTVGVDDLDTIAGATFEGDVSVDFGGGTNNADFFGTFNGSTVSYTGGDGVDTVNYDFSGNPADVTVNLGADDDAFTLGPNASIAPTTLFVDFGNNNDTFTNNFGPFTFDASLHGYSGYDFDYTLATDSLVATELTSAATVEFDNNGPGNTFRLNNAIVLPGATNLTVNMLSGSGTTLGIEMDFALPGDLTVNLGDGARALNFISGVSNTFNGNVAVTGGSDSQTVEVAVNLAFTVGGNATFDLGTGADTVDEDGNDVSITGNLDLIGVNEFENGGTMSIGGNVFVDTSAETETSRFDDDSALAIGGDFTYLGGDGRDEVLLNDFGATTVGGNVFIDVADNTTGGTQFIWLNDTGTTISGNLTVLSTNSASSDDYQDLAGATINGDILIDLGGGNNEADLVGTFGGSKVKYTGGSGVDDVTYGMTGAPAFVNAKLGTGDDLFTLNAGASISPTTLRVDFGGGNDTFTNNFGAFTFNAALLNWHGYNRFYTFTDDMWNMHQVLDTGDVTLDDNGAGGAIRLTSSGVTEMTPATNVRLNLLDNSSTNVTVDLDSGLAGNLLLQLRHGARDVAFTGTSNSVGGYVILLGGDGVNNFDLAVNADLNVGGDVIINGRDGSDLVDDGANNITAGGNFILRGINTFENTNTLTVGGNFNMVTLLESEKSFLDNDGTMNIAGGVNYLGGGGTDDVLLNMGGVSVGLTLYVHLGDSDDLVNAQHVSLTGGVFAEYVSIKGGDVIVGNEFLTDATTIVSGDVIVDFSGSTVANKAWFFGTYGGTYGTFRGGTAGDVVNFGATAIDMAFVSLMNEGDDTFFLEGTTSLLSLVVDFGDNTDTFVDNLGLPGPFPVTILNLP